jgi:hypothetical protein
MKTVGDADGLTRMLEEIADSLALIVMTTLEVVDADVVRVDVTSDLLDKTTLTVAVAWDPHILEVDDEGEE